MLGKAFFCLEDKTCKTFKGLGRLALGNQHEAGSIQKHRDIGTALYQVLIINAFGNPAETELSPIVEGHKSVWDYIHYLSFKFGK